MAVVVGMFDQSFAHIGSRLDALGLDIKVHTFGRDGMFVVDGVKMAPREIALDYVWLSTHLNTDGFRDQAFDMMLGCKSIGVLQTFNAGLDHPFYKKLSEKGTRICNSSAQGIAIAEYVLGQVLSVLQPIELQRKLQAEKQWKITPFREISQTRWLIIGFGPIGEELAKRVKAFDAQIDVIRRTPKASSVIDRVGTMGDLKSFLGDADIVVLACSLTDETRGFVDASFFNALKTGAILVNIARGALIDDAQLLLALDSGTLATAILDVFHQEPLPADSLFWGHPNVRMTGHTSFGGSGARSRWDALFLYNIARFVRGEPLVQLVNPKDLV
ncbi:MAG: NAD(P)-dependent oxidoreductase [Hyphomicrobiaceae bacterium]|nr:D-2-hydroxyacid dehydrogenase [Hyphomicrobiaceae bacterium]